VFDRLAELHALMRSLIHQKTNLTDTEKLALVRKILVIKKQQLAILKIARKDERFQAALVIDVIKLGRTIVKLEAGVQK
jgi:hypothetical protein